MPQQLSPSEDFPIVRVLSDHTDVSTNYVQAVITDATTDAVLATLNLDDKGNRRFKKIWHVPYDNVYSRGRFIVITTTVFTDAGYTQKNPNYGEVGDTYLIQQRFDLRYLPAGADSVDYKQLRKVVNEELAALKLNDLEPLPIAEPIDHRSALKEVAASIDRVSGKVDAIKIPEPITPESVNLTPILAAIDALTKTLTALPKFKETDLSPILRTVTTELHTLRGFLQTHKQEIVQEVKAAHAEPKTFTLSTGPDNQAAAKRENELKRLAAKHSV